MADLLTATRSQVAISAGRKTDPTVQNRVRELVISTPAAWSASLSDTASTGLILAKGTRLVNGVGVSNAAGAASSTLSVGLRSVDKATILDATAIVNALAITSAANATIFTGTKLITGQEYTLPYDCEVYLTFSGAAPTANQAIRVEVPYIAP